MQRPAIKNQRGPANATGVPPRGRPGASARAGGRTVVGRPQCSNRAGSCPFLLPLRCSANPSCMACSSATHRCASDRLRLLSLLILVCVNDKERSLRRFFGPEGSHHANRLRLRRRGNAQGRPSRSPVHAAATRRHDRRQVGEVAQRRADARRGGNGDPDGELLVNAQSKTALSALIVAIGFAAVFHALFHPSNGLLSERHGLFVFVLRNGLTDARVACLDGIARQPPCASCTSSGIVSPSCCSNVISFDRSWT